MLTRLIRWLSLRIAEHLVIGARCGLCGAWVRDVIVLADWRWTVCDRCAWLTEPHTDSALPLKGPPPDDVPLRVRHTERR